MPQEVHWKTYIAHPQLLLARSQCREDMRKLLKSMTKENVRKKKNVIGQLSHSQPLIVGEAMLDQVYTLHPTPYTLHPTPKTQPASYRLGPITVGYLLRFWLA